MPGTRPCSAAGDSCLGILYVKRAGCAFPFERGGTRSLYRPAGGRAGVRLSASCVLSAVTFDVDYRRRGKRYSGASSHVFGPLMAENIYVECFVYRTATELFSDVIGAVERLLFMTLEQRVASFLLDEAARRGTDTLAITQEAIALGIASAREAVTRALRQLAARGLVEVFRGGVKSCWTAKPLRSLLRANRREKRRRRVLFLHSRSAIGKGGPHHATEQPYKGSVAKTLFRFACPFLVANAAIAVWRSRPVCGGGFLRGAKRGRRLYRHTGDANCHKPRHRPYAGQHRHHWAVYRPGEYGKVKRAIGTTLTVFACVALALTAGMLAVLRPLLRLFADAAACLRACGAVCHRVHAGQPVHLRL